MLIEQLIFYAFASVLVFSGLMVIVAGNPVRSALFLVLAFFASAGLWLLLEAEFLALILVLVYVGAVMTLFLFVVMTLNLDAEELRRVLWRYLPIGLILCALLVALASYALIHGLGEPVAPLRHAADYSNTEALGRVLYTQYAYPFELAGVLLLVAIIAAIALSFRPARNRKVQQPEQQVRVKRSDRIRLIKMPAEKQAPLGDQATDKE